MSGDVRQNLVTVNDAANVFELELEDEVDFRDFFQEVAANVDAASTTTNLRSDIETLLRDRIENLESENGHLRQELDETRQAWLNDRESNEKKMMQLKESREVTKKKEAMESSVKWTASQELEDPKSKNDLPSNEINVDRVDASTLTDNDPQDEDRIKLLKEKLQQSNAKLCETKNNCAHLRQELNKAQKVLRSEIGESATTIASLLSERRAIGGWRGRAQQIRRLEQTVAQLRAKLRDRESDSVSPSSLSNFTVCTEQRNLAHLRNLEKERRRTMEERSMELGRAELALQKSEKQIQAARARIKILENDLNNARTKLALLNEKRMHDDRLIEALNAQLGAVEDKFRERERLARNEKNKAEESCKEMRNELSSLNAQLELLRIKLAERETEISTLRNGIEKPERRGAADPHEIASSSLQQPPIANNNVNRQSPRDTREPKNAFPNEYVTLSLAAEAERQRLLELVALLNGRVDKERLEVDRISDLLRQERTKSAKLETKLQRLEMERVGIATGKIDSGYSRGRTRGFKCSANLAAVQDAAESDKLGLKVELLQEECLALRARLTTIERDKATDLAVYKKMLQQTRATFQQAFRFPNIAFSSIEEQVPFEFLKT